MKTKGEGDKGDKLTGEGKLKKNTFFHPLRRSKLNFSSCFDTRLTLGQAVFSLQAPNTLSLDSVTMIPPQVSDKTDHGMLDPEASDPSSSSSFF